MSESNNKNQSVPPSGKEDSNTNKIASSEKIESVGGSRSQTPHEDSSSNKTGFNDDTSTEQSKNVGKETGKDNKKDQRRETIGLRSFAKNIIFGENESVEKENNSSLFGTVLETGDKAKSEMVRMFGREVRNYLNALEIGKDVHNLLTNYSLEISASVHLKPLADKMKEESSSSNKKEEDE